MNYAVSSPIKYNGKLAGMVIEYLDQGRLKSGLVTREQERHLAVIDPNAHERTIPLLFVARTSSAAASVMLEALLGDRIYFVRRHMDFVARTPEQVERLRMQNDRIRARSDDYRKIQQQMRDVVNGAETPSAEDAAALIDQLSRYLKNPFTRSREMTQMLTQAAPEVDAAEAAYEILERLGARPRVPRFAFVAGLKDDFSDAVLKDANEAVPGPRALTDGGYAVTIDDEDTLEVDDALSCEALADGGMRVRVHIALVADFVKKGNAMDAEAAPRATTG